MNKKVKIFNLILSIVTPILLITVVVLAITYGWYMQRQQTANIDATTKNLAVEYIFDDEEESNAIEYNVDNISFFDYSKVKDEGVDATWVEMTYLPIMAVKLDITLKNNSDNDISYKITFEALKDVIADTSTAYVDCIFNSIPTITSSVRSIDDLKTNGNGITYTNTESKITAVYDSNGLSSNKTIATSAQAKISLYIFGVQEIDGASNDDFLYETKTVQGEEVKSLKKHSFKLIFEAVPVGDVVVEEND